MFLVTELSDILKSYILICLCLYSCYKTICNPDMEIPRSFSPVKPPSSSSPEGRRQLTDLKMEPPPPPRGPVSNAASTYISPLYDLRRRILLQQLVRQRNHGQPREDLSPAVPTAPPPTTCSMTSPSTKFFFFWFFFPFLS